MSICFAEKIFLKNVEIEMDSVKSGFLHIKYGLQISFIIEKYFYAYHRSG